MIASMERDVQIRTYKIHSLSILAISSEASFEPSPSLVSLSLVAMTVTIGAVIAIITLIMALQLFFFYHLVLYLRRLDRHVERIGHQAGHGIGFEERFV